ncbi:response regulator [Myxococcota bacterium]|jgi:two-component system cell cycle sensor histidine kinase/response regulator CckA|nr:response regulator [Myxococcota bacterium]
MMNKKDLERLLDQLDEPVFGCDEDGIVVYANRAAATLLGEVEEGQDENPADTWLQGDDGLLFPQVGESVERDVWLLRGGGRGRRLRVRVSPWPYSGALGWAVHVKSLDPQADRAAGMQAIARLIADQLGEHLKVIISNASTGLMGGPSEPEAEAQRLRDIHAAGQSAAVLQRQLTALDARDRTRAYVDLGELLNDATPALRALIGEERLRLDVPDDTLMVTGDPDALAMLLDELGGWLRDALTAGGEARMWAVAHGDDHVRLCAALIGVTLSQADRERLFTSDDGGGLTLALAVLSAHGGRLLLEPGARFGPTLTVELPSASRAARTAQREARLGNETILLVEDEPTTLEWMTESLRRLGYRVIAADNGITASALLREHRAELDLVLTDVVLPGRSGLELYAECRAGRPAPRVLLMSGYSSDFLGDPHLTDVQLLQKPVGPTLLAAAIRELLDRP